jgi:hypothetical protein
MTPEEKAIELINKMNNVDLNCENESMCMLYPHALECALIAVNEIINQYNSGMFDYKILNEEESDYWNKVKQEIETKINKIK